MSELRSQLERQRRHEQQVALRALLSGGLVLRGEAGWDSVLRQESWLRGWLGDWTGWGVKVDRQAGFARLLRSYARPDATRPARDHLGRPLSRRRYVLVCLLAAALYEVQGQTTLSRLTEEVRARAEQAGLSPLDPTRISERRALIDALRWLEARGVLRQRDGSADGYLRSDHGDVLYDVEDRLIPYLISAPRGPASVDTPAAMHAADVAGHHQAQLQQARFRVMRLLLDEPVVYFDDLSAGERDWLLRSWSRVVERIAEAGLILERRQEGVAAIDPGGDLSDLRFPSARSTGQHVALLLCDWLHGRTPPHATTHELEAHIEQQRAAYTARWREAATAALVSEAIEILSAMRLLQQTPTGWAALPASARFRVAAQEPPR